MEINTENKQDRNYGILIVNNSSSIIREVQVTVQIKGKEERSTNIKFLYPGKYEVWKKEDPKYPWDFPTPSNNDDNARNVYPIMVSQKYKVLEMTFLDGMNTKWSIKEGVLSKIEDKGENRS